MKTMIPLLALMAQPAFAGTLEIQPVADNVYALVGPITQRSPENFGNNATFGIIVTPEGVVLVDAGGSWNGAKDIEETIDQITDQPVKYVINTGGQDHRWLGNGYWQNQGAVVITSVAAEADRFDRLTAQFAMLTNFLGDALEGTEPVRADITFEDSYSLNFGGETIEIIHPDGGGHTPGDSFVWLADTSTMFSGDIVFSERILGVGEMSNVKDWIEGFEVMSAYAPVHLVPGHGHATTLATATHDTYDYLVNLRTKMGEYIEGGGDIFNSTSIDQSAFSYLANFKAFAGKNAQRTFEQMEWE